jgi:uncharacterized protein (DUF1330 family)
MPAYIVVRIDVKDHEAYQRYIAMAPESIGRYGGRYLTRGGPTEALEGDLEPKRFVILEFDSMERAKAWFHSPEYAPALEIRRQAADSIMILAEGLPVPFVPGAPATR